jgi:hypothetical protein
VKRGVKMLQKKNVEVAEIGLWGLSEESVPNRQGRQYMLKSKL